MAWQELRIAVEQEASRLAAQRRSTEDLGRIRAIHEELVDRDREGDRAGALDFRFQLSIAAATQNKVLVETQESLGNHIHDWMATMLSQSHRPNSERREFRMREHEAILEAIARMDPWSSPGLMDTI